MSGKLHAQKLHSLKLHFSNKYSYAQIVRNSDGHIVASASTIEKGLQEGLSSTSDKVASEKVGSSLAQRALRQGIDRVEWVRKRNQRYHGKIACLLTAMQDGGVRLG
jgi:large subunit ribosomal protein L18